MDRDLGQLVAGSANRAAAELGNLALLVKGRCTPEEHEKLSLAIGSAVYEACELMERVFELCPGLKEDFESRLERFDRAY